MQHMQNQFAIDKSTDYIVILKFLLLIELLGTGYVKHLFYLCDWGKINGCFLFDCCLQMCGNLKETAEQLKVLVKMKHI